ncbi:MAG TPA: M48 family metalloprotease [Usitatibacter sp.]|nr:M48 family metalloprotease [Usitatibacter sp.]
MKRAGWILVGALALAAGGARAIDFGSLINQAIDTGKALQEANHEFTTDEEVALGDGLAAGFLGAAPLRKDPELQRYVNRVGKWLAMHSDRPDLPWTFGVVDTETVNAFALPGGTVLITYGLLKRLGSESELAGALAHEIAHVVKKHQLQAIQSDRNSAALAGLGKAIAGEAIARRGNDPVGLKTWGANAGVELLKNGVFLRPLDRSMEYEADKLGVVIAARSGYDPYGLVGVLEMLAQTKSDGSGLSVLDTHPPPADRLAELEGFVPLVEREVSDPKRLQARFRKAVGAAP